METDNYNQLIIITGASGAGRTTAINVFEDVGFEVIKLFHRNNFSHWKQNLACKIWPHLSEEIIIIGQKL